MFGKLFQSHSKNASRLVFGTTMSQASLTFNNFSSAFELLEFTKGAQNSNELWKDTSTYFDKQLIKNKH